MEELIKTIIQVVAYIAPFFLIPATFKFGLGIFGNLAGMVNDRSRGLFDRQKKYRAGKQAEGWNRFKTGTGKGALRQSGLVRRAGMNLGAGYEGRFGFGERGAQSRAQIASLAAMEQVMKNPRWATIQENDDALHAATYENQAAAQAALSRRFRGQINSQSVSNFATENGLTEAEARSRMERRADERASQAAAAAGSSIGFGRSQAIAAARQLATTGTGYVDNDDQIETIARASGGDKGVAADIAGYNNFINKQKGRHDLAPGAGALIEASRDAIDKTPRTQQKLDKLTEDSWNSGSLYQIANGKAGATKNFGNYWTGQYEKALESNDVNQIARASIAMQEFKAMLPNASGENQKEINAVLARMGAAREEYLRNAGTTTGGPATLMQATLTQAEGLATQQARVYERYDPNRN